MKRRVCLLLTALAVLMTACAKDQIGISTSLSSLKDPDLAWSAKDFTATYGADNDFPTLVNKYGVGVAFSSSDEAVATISADNDGEPVVTLVGVGTTVITASSEATTAYEAGSASYTLTVEVGAAGLAWSATRASVLLGSDDFSAELPVLSNPYSLDISYASSNESVAVIDGIGVVSLVAAGSTVITATSAATGQYDAMSVSYTLTVREEDSDLADADLTWSVSAYTATMASEDNVFPTLSNEHALAVTYTSTDETVASISADGTITLVGAGTVAITANSEATGTYAAGSAWYTLKVVKHAVTLGWSESSLSVALDDEGSVIYPTLSVDPDETAISEAITYASSNPDAATIASDGTVTLVAAGKTTISATFAGDNIYKAASASYSLTVSTTADDGAVETVFPSSGGGTSDADEISNTTFTRLVTVTYSSSGATVSGYTASGVADYFTVTTSGNQVTVTYTGEEYVAYKLTGTASDGFFKLYSSKKQALWLSGLSLTCSSGAAINNQSGKRTYVYLEGTNTLQDGASAAYSASGDEDMKGVFFSEGQLIFSGGGSLSVTARNAQGKSGIVSDDYVRMMGSPTVTVTAGSSAGHGIKVNEYVRLTGGTLHVTAQANMKKGINSEDYVLVEGGTTTVTVSGGVAYDSEDGEYTGTAGIKADNYFAMTGGSVTITNSGNGGKGLRAGSYDYDATSHTLSDSYITGGTLKITTTGSESNDVSAKGIKIGWATKNGTGDHATVTGYAGNMVIGGGTVIVNCSKSEGFEAKGNLTIDDGSVYVVSSGDDAINCQAEMNVNGGYVYAFSSANDAMDANHDLKLNGGYTFAVTTAGNPEVAIDANTESDYKLYINSGATVVAYGGLERGYSSSQSVYTMSCTAGSWNALYNSGSYLCAFKAPSGVSSVSVSSPAVSSGYKGVSVSGTTYSNGIWAVSGISGGTAVSLSGSSSGGSSSGGGPGSGGRPGGH